VDLVDLPAASVLAAVTMATVTAPFVVHAVLLRRAAAAKRRLRAACPFEDDDHDPLAAGAAVRLVVAESLLWLYAVATSAFPPAVASGVPGGVPIVLLPAPWLPRAVLRTLAARLRRDGFFVLCPTRPRAGRRAARTAWLDHELRSAWERYGCRQVDVIAVAGAASDAVAHLAAGGSGIPRVRRLLTIGSRAEPGEPRVPPATEVTAIFSYDDPLGGSPEAARRPGAFAIALRGIGRLGLVHAPHVYTLLRENLDATRDGSAPAWRTASSS
jgi:hypothetical protein